MKVIDKNLSNQKLNNLFYFYDNHKKDNKIIQNSPYVVLHKNSFFSYLLIIIFLSFHDQLIIFSKRTIKINKIIFAKWKINEN